MLCWWSGAATRHHRPTTSPERGSSSGAQPSSCDHVTPALKQLHWLPVASRIKFKLCLFMHLIHLGRAPQYLLDCVQLVNTSSTRHLGPDLQNILGKILSLA